MKWIIDTDPGIDDAAAIITFLAYRGEDVLGITTVHGNVGIEHTTRNALRLVELMGTDIPVCKGLTQPLLQPPATATAFHGSDGFGDVHLPDPTRTVAPGHAVDFIIDQVHRHAGDICLLTLGPLSNIGVAIAKDRSIAKEIREIHMMAGTCWGRGNTTAASEFNIYTDPEAAAIVFASGIPITVVPWETCVDTMFGSDVIDEIRKTETPVGRLFGRAMEFAVKKTLASTGSEGVILCDLLAACAAIDPNVVLESERVLMRVETGGVYSRGFTVVDGRLSRGIRPNAVLCTKCDRPRIASMLLAALRRETP
ncbi:MAG TPA: nucleoside hydrolase [Firmicutes bacterium]|nr:nucleoside hydrolase [Candidatus Fermentithermobacillaceae bacterium]